MSYQTAYTTRFDSLDDTPWEVVVYIEGFLGTPTEISLEADEPCVIEWQETQKTDAVQPSACTLRVSNEKDRQMTPLMGHPDALVIVSRDGKPYWVGHLDDAVYEEPYSYEDGYVTELTFSDFGILNRTPFTLTGRQSLHAIVYDCLETIGFGNGLPVSLFTSLLDPDTFNPITLGQLYIDASRFAPDADTWGATTTKREVLEEILRPLGLRIMQKNARMNIYDIEYLRDHDDLHNYPVWKGTDAYLAGSDTYGRFEVAFEPDARETLAGGEADYDENHPDEGPYFAHSLNPDGTLSADIGFHINDSHVPHCPDARLLNGAKMLRTTADQSDTNDVCIAWRAICRKVLYQINNGNGQSTPVEAYARLVNNYPANLAGLSQAIFHITSGHIPLTPDRDNYQLRVNLDFIFSFRPNPFDKMEGNPHITELWGDREFYWRQRGIRIVMVPAKLELLDDQGNAIFHYRNADSEDRHFNSELQYCAIDPLGPGKGTWEEGPADGFGDMFLAYYGNLDGDDGTPASSHIQPGDDNDCDPIVKPEGGWTTNRQTLSESLMTTPLIASRRQGEYVPMPPSAGRLRLTIGSGVFGFRPKCYAYQAHLYAYDLQNVMNDAKWQLYRNPEIAIVKANRKDDGIDTGTVYNRTVAYDSFLNPKPDTIADTLKAGTWQKGIAPSARGLLSRADGTVWQQLAKEGELRTLNRHRLRFIANQTYTTQPVISGTAELDILFRAKREAFTPGVFLVTALRQDLHQATERLTMACIGGYADTGETPPGFTFQASWTDHLCTLAQATFAFLWSDPFCTLRPGPFQAAWSDPLCTQRYDYDLNWKEMLEDH